MKDYKPHVGDVLTYKNGETLRIIREVSDQEFDAYPGTDLRAVYPGVERNMTTWVVISSEHPGKRVYHSFGTVKVNSDFYNLNEHWTLIERDGQAIH
jgi:hypothetical protein